MMFGAGLIMMALVFGLPLVLIVAVVAAIAAASSGGWQRWFGSAPARPASGPAAETGGRYCAHCGQALQAGWAHCPFCGASTAAG